MFKVYGVTREVALKKAEAKIKNIPKDEQPKTPDEYQELLESMSDNFFKTMKPVVIGKSFDAPQFAEELISLAKKTTTCRSMSIKINIPKTDSKGGIVLNKRTKKPSMQWVDYDPKFDYEASSREAYKAREEAFSAKVNNGDKL